MRNLTKQLKNFSTHSSFGTILSRPSFIHKFELRSHVVYSTMQKGGGKNKDIFHRWRTKGDLARRALEGGGGRGRGNIYIPYFSLKIQKPLKKKTSKGLFWS